MTPTLVRDGVRDHCGPGRHQHEAVLVGLWKKKGLRFLRLIGVIRRPAPSERAGFVLTPGVRGQALSRAMITSA